MYMYMYNIANIIVLMANCSIHIIKCYYRGLPHTCTCMYTCVYVFVQCHVLSLFIECVTTLTCSLDDRLMEGKGQYGLPQAPQKVLDHSAQNVDVGNLVQTGVTFGPEQTIPQLFHCPVKPE